MKKYSIFLAAVLLIFCFAEFGFADNAQKPSITEKQNIFENLQTNKIELFFVDPLKNKKPKNACENNAGLSLLTLIENAHESIDFAIYGIGGQDEIFNALVDAKKRGVIVRGLADATQDNINIYKDTDELAFALKTVKNDYLSPTKMRNPTSQNYEFDITNAIMHNKFFIVDNQYVWTGSTNVSSTCMNYNANNVIVIDSAQIANLFSQEFNQMYEKGLFHEIKDLIKDNENICLNDKTTVSVYFLPVHNPINRQIKPLIQNAKKTLDIEIFYLTHKGIIYELIEAQRRGVKIRVIVDAASAGNEFSKYPQLREKGISVKVENWGGKMHKKSMIVDNEILVIGSMNWTTSAQYHNDENVLVVKNTQLATQAEIEFDRLWNAIPYKWLYKTPRAEGFDSKNSRKDGVDNDHDGKVDKYDEDCHFIKAFTPKRKIITSTNLED